MERSQLATQECFSWLALPNWQHAALLHDALDQCNYEPASRSGSASSLKSEIVPATEEQTAYIPVNFISEEARAFLLAYETAAARRAEIGNVSGHEFSIPVATDMYEPERILACSAPPKRFFRTFWQSVSIRLLKLEEQRLRLVRADAGN